MKVEGGRGWKEGRMGQERLEVKRKYTEEENEREVIGREVREIL